MLPVKTRVTHSGGNELTMMENALQENCKPYCDTSSSDQIGKYFILFSLNILNTI